VQNDFKNQVLKGGGGGVDINRLTFLSPFGGGGPKREGGFEKGERGHKEAISEFDPDRNSIITLTKPGTY